MGYPALRRAQPAFAGSLPVFAIVLQQEEAVYGKIACKGTVTVAGPGLLILLRGEVTVGNGDVRLKGHLCIQHAETKGLPGTADAVAFLAKTFRRPDGERVARQAVETLAQLAAVAALNRTAPEQAALFAATRFGDTHGRMYGAVDLSGDDSRRLLERALPVN